MIPNGAFRGHSIDVFNEGPSSVFLWTGLTSESLSNRLLKRSLSMLKTASAQTSELVHRGSFEGLP